MTQAQKDSRKSYYYQNRDLELAYGKDWRNKHPEYMKEYMKEYYKRNRSLFLQVFAVNYHKRKNTPELRERDLKSMRLANRKWYWRNRDKMLIKFREYRLKRKHHKHSWVVNK